MCNERESIRTAGAFHVGQTLALRDGFNTQMPRRPASVVVDSVGEVMGRRGTEAVVALQVVGQGTPAYPVNECMLLSVEQARRMYDQTYPQGSGASAAVLHAPA